MPVCRQHNFGNQMNSSSELIICAGDITAFTKVVILKINLTLRLVYALSSSLVMSVYVPDLCCH